MNADAQTIEKFEAWGLLELFGHTKLAGKLTDQTIGGVHFIRCDVPQVGDVAGYSRFFTQGAIYGMTITTEDVARKVAGYLRAVPVSAYEMRTVDAPRLASATSVDVDDDDPDRPF